MISLLDIAAALVGLAVGATIGFALGRAVGSRVPWRFWASAVVILIAGIALAAYGEIASQRLAWMAAIGLFAGGFSGLKYGAGRVPGLAGTPHARPDDTPRGPVAGGFADRSKDAPGVDSEVRRH